MAKKKGKKIKHQASVQPGDLVKQAEEQLKSGRLDEAIKNLTRAETEVQRKLAAASGKEGPLLTEAAMQPKIAHLLAQALFARATAAREPSKKVADLGEAVKRAPSEVRYLLELGATLIAIGEPERAFNHLGKARELSPDDPLVERAFMLGLLAAGQTREVKERFKQLPEERRDAHLKRLAIIRNLVVGTFSIEDLALVLRPSAVSIEDHLVNSLLLLHIGEVERAKEQLSRVPTFDHNPSQSEIAVVATQFFYNGALNFQTRHFKEAATELRQAQQLAQAYALRLPWLARLAPYFHKIAEEAVAEADLNLAVDCWHHALELDPGDKVAAANLETSRLVQANQMWRNGQLEQAIALWKESLKTNAQNDHLLRNVAIGLEKIGRKEEAINYWRALARRWRQQIKARSSDAQFKARLLSLEKHLIDEMMQADRPDFEITDEMESALKIDPTDHQLRRKFAEWFLEISRPRQALKHLEIIERSQGESADLLVQKGIALEMLDRHAAAQKCLERAIEIDPSNAVARRSYIMMLGNEAVKADENDELERAIEICQKQLSIDPQYAPALSHLASLYFDIGDEEAAQKTIARIIEVDPNSPQRHIMAGSIYLENGFDKEAKAEFDRAVEIEPSDKCFFAIGAEYLENDLLKEALKYFEQAVEVDSFDVILEVARILNSFGHKREAEKYIDRAMKKDLQHPEPHLAKSAMLMERGKPDEALRELDEAERLAEGRKDFEEILDEIRFLKDTIKQIQEINQFVGALGSRKIGIGEIPPEIKRLIAKLAGDL